MNVTTALTILTWVLVVVGAAAVVLLVVLKGWAVRIAVVGAAAILMLAAWAVRNQISSIPETSPAALCTGGVSWFGIGLTGPDDLCARYR